MKVLDLFSGIGGFALGLHRAGFTTIAFCEREPFCARVLAKHWPEIPIYDDVRTLTAARLRADGVAAPDAIVGGFPCQPHSVAGRRAGVADDRHLWPEFARLVGELCPRWVIAENVAGIRTTAADEVLGDLEALGYTCGAWVVGADDVGAPHRRKRVWFVAHADERRREWQQRQAGSWQAGAARGPGGGGADVGDAEGDGLAFRERLGRHLLQELEAAHGAGVTRVWPRRAGGVEPGVGGAADGLPARLDGGVTFPTPAAASYGSNQGGAAGRVGAVRHSLDSMARSGMWPTPHGHGDDGHGGELSQAMRVAEGSSDSARSAAKVGAWHVEPWERGIPRVVPRGTLNRTHRLKALGNAVVPQVVEAIGRAVLACEG